MLFMGLHVFAELVLAMTVMIQDLPCHDRPWTQCFGNAVLWWKSIQPEHHLSGQLDDHSIRHLLERNNVETAS